MRHASPSSTTSDPELDLRREQRRLRRAFTALVFAAAPAGLAQACEPLDTPHVLASPDASTRIEPGPDGQAGTDAHEAGDDARDDAGDDAPASSDAAPDADAPATSCALEAAEGDAGADASEPLCLYTLPCGLPAELSVLGCVVYMGPVDASLPLGCTLVDGEGCTAGAYVPGPGGAVTIACPGCLGGGGRRPRGLARLRGTPAPTALGVYFARMAHDEAASVYAFLRMRDELASHGAPRALVRAAERSARDEARHARVMARFARIHGAPTSSPRVRRGAPRSLEAMARENAVEGCVHETFGALTMRWQAARARDAAVRSSFARIASDEARHAALSWTVARWLEARLDAAGRARVEAARARALHALERGGRCSPFDAAAGRPDPASRAALLTGMIERLGLAA